MDQVNIPQSGLWGTIANALNAMFDVIFGRTGWADYSDTQYTDVSPFSIVADTDTILPNNAGSSIITQLPTDVPNYYDGTTINSLNGDSILITVDMKAVPTGAGTTTLDVWFDIGGAVGELYRRVLTFPKGVGVIRPVSFSVSAYTLGTWEANGATVYVRSNGPADFYDIRYVIVRTHKAR